MANSDQKWIPTPRFLCRKAVFLSLLREVKGSSFLEIGVGAGGIFLDVLKKGYRGLGIDISSEAVKVTKERISGSYVDARVECLDLFDIKESFDLVVCLEVLEHIEDDRSFLHKINSCLNEDGCLILSVPAHQNKWGSGDVWAGHYRRYEKKELQQKLENAGFLVLKKYNYGFPVTNILSPIRNHFLGESIVKENLSRSERNKASGLDRKLGYRYAFLINNFTMLPFLLIQRIFLEKDFGDGYLFLAKRHNS